MLTAARNNTLVLKLQEYAFRIKNKLGAKKGKPFFVINKKNEINDFWKKGAPAYHKLLDACYTPKNSEYAIHKLSTANFHYLTSELNIGILLPQPFHPF